MTAPTPDARNENADGALMAQGDAGCTVHAELAVTDSGAKLARLNVTTPWDTWIGVDLTAVQLRELARRLVHFADNEMADA